MIEVPDDEDDTSFQKWLASGSPMISLKPCPATLPTPPKSPTHRTKSLPNEGVEVTSPTVAKPIAVSAKVQKVPHRWMKPFEVDWTL